MITVAECMYAFDKNGKVKYAYPKATKNRNLKKLEEAQE